MRRRKWILAAVVPLMLLSALPGESQPIVRKTITYFSIGGMTAADLDREFTRRGPLSNSTGRRHPGATQIKFNGSAKFVTKGRLCYVAGAKVSLSTRIMLPRWSNRKKAGREMGLLWDTLSSDIKRHEERHAEIARNHARGLEKAILALPPAGNCAALKAKVNKISQQALAAHDADQQRFDRVEAINFENRMMRLLKNRISNLSSKKG